MKDTLRAPEPMRKWFEEQRMVRFWGTDHDITPRLIDQVFGDGGKLATLAPMATRPNYYGVMIDSSWTEDDLAEHDEVLIQAIEAEYGNSADSRDDEDEEDEAGWPAWHDGGHSYGLVTDVPEHVRKASAENLLRQRKEQCALFIGQHRIHPGTVLLHPVFGMVQARRSDELGWHFCRTNVLHKMQPGFIGFGTDLSRLTVDLSQDGYTPASSTAGIHFQVSSPLSLKSPQCPASQVLDQVLEGDERAAAHSALYRLLGQSTTPDDAAVLAWARQDPSLFTEVIPSSAPNSDGGADQHWADMSTWCGTWLARAAETGCVRTISALLDAGVHPDDDKVFPVKRLLWHKQWHMEPALLTKALAHGAEPDADRRPVLPGGYRADPSESLVRRLLREAKGALVARKSDAQLDLQWFQAAVEAVEKLLDAGATRVDPSDTDYLFDDRRHVIHPASEPLALTMLLEAYAHLELREEAQALVHRIAIKLRAAGARVDVKLQGQRAPLTLAVETKDLETFRLLVQMGADASDAAIVVEHDCTDGSSSYGFPARPLLVQAFDIGGPEYQAAVTQALMETTLANRSSTPAVAAAAPRRKRLRL